MFSYQIFDFIQLMRGEAVISGEGHRTNPEFGLITRTGYVDVGGSFLSLL
jgi:hypothetical protein